MFILRTNCIICNSKDLDDVINFEQFPIIFSQSLDTNFMYFDHCIQVCNNCNQIQNKNLIDLSLLYKNVNHNISVIGKIWENHYKEFVTFISKRSKSINNVCEIGSSSHKIYDMFSKVNVNEWYIIEPNISEKYTEITYIHDFFSKDSNFDIKFDIVILSHVFEHFYEPYESLYKLKKMINKNGFIFISVPNMCSTNMVLKGLHVEHTFHVTLENIEYLCSLMSLEVFDYIYYSDHSLFVQIGHMSPFYNKTSSLDILKKSNELHSNQLINEYDNILIMLKQVNNVLTNYSAYYLYGSHVINQYYIKLGLNIEKCKCILDIDTNKHDTYLYGTPLLCKDVKTIQDDNHCVIFSKMGVYNNEIIKQCNLLNDNIIWL